MKKIIFLLFLVYVNFYGLAQNTADLDEKNGFREMKFGDSISNYKDMIPVSHSKDSSVIFYRKRNDKLTIAKNYTASVIYAFYKGHFFLVKIKIDTREGSTYLLHEMQNKYGKGFKNYPEREQYIWSGKRVLMFFTFYINNESETIIVSKFFNDGIEKYNPENISRNEIYKKHPLSKFKSIPNENKRIMIGSEFGYSSTGYVTAHGLYGKNRLMYVKDSISKEKLINTILVISFCVIKDSF